MATDPRKVSIRRSPVRRQNESGEKRRTDQNKEQLGGYCLLDCKDLDEALAWARKIPMPGARPGRGGHPNRDPGAR